MKNRKLLAKALREAQTTSALVKPSRWQRRSAFGFQLSRIKESHHIFVHPRFRELVNLQEVDGKAKPYQVRQLLESLNAIILD